MDTSSQLQIQDAKNYLQSLYYTAYHSNVKSLIVLSHMIKNAESKLVQLETNIK